MSNIVQKTLKITCKSDWIVGSGEGWGNIIDTDVVHDPYGFPFIPARRMKGLIREAFWEMQQFSLVDQDTIDAIFGNDSSNHYFVLDNTYLENIEKLQEEVFNFSINESTVLEHFTETRYQTKVDENGIAEENSLRSSRAIRKGTEFFANIELEEEYLDIFSKAIQFVSHAGVNRTRGFGEIKLELVDSKIVSSSVKMNSLKDEKEYIVTLCMKNLSPLSIPSVNGMESLDYISGSSLQGFFLNNYLRNNTLDDFFYEMLDNVKFCNAYISDNKFHEYMPVHESLYKQKVGKDYYDKIVVDNEKEILKKVNHKYIFRNQIKEVDTEMFYHHRRPEDKSIGHVLDNAGKGSGMFYQLEVMSPNQYFVGHIVSKGKYLKSLFKDISSFVRLGSSKNVQYGMVHLVDVQTKEWQPTMLKKGKEVVVEFIEPVVCLDKKREAILEQKELASILHIQPSASFVGYTEVGGYNSKWKLQKPSYHAFSKGSCIKGTLLENMPAEVIIGNLTNEGNGLVRIRLVKELAKKAFQNELEERKPNPKNIIFTKPIYVDFLKKQVYTRALEEILNNSKKIELSPSANGRALKMASKPLVELFLADVEGIKDEEKRNEILYVYDFVKQVCEDKVNQSDLSKVTNPKQLCDIKKELTLQMLRESFVKRKMEGRSEK
ncbi:MAG: RAMP superfamily CRISPR-associated protein [Bacillota bacterium]|nr:RAMP superfamily CRISPR-associated protein [Bacillota bacterium]